MKRVLSVLLAVLFLLTALPLGAIPVFAASSGTTGACTWTVDDDGHLTISGNGPMGRYNPYSSAIGSAPWGSSITSVTIEEGVTTIGSYAFWECDNLTSIPIPDSVTFVGDHAFTECSNLTTVTIPNGITSISANMFSLCKKLTSVNIPDSVTSIGGYAFYHCDSLTTVSIPDSVTSIGGYAFSWCAALRSVNIPDSVTYIGSAAFRDTALISVTIPDSVTTLGDSAFYYCTSLTSATIQGNIDTIGENTFYHCTSLTSVTIPDSVTSIKESAFKSCDSLMSILIPNGVTTIGKEAFYYCTSLSWVAIPSSVTHIDLYAFEGCNGLSAVYISDLSAWCRTSFGSVKSNPLEYAKNLYLNGNLVTDLVIPDNVTAITPYAFYNCDSLISISIPDSVTTIGNYAFGGCDALQTVYYGGTTEDRASINIGVYNTALTNATWHYFSGPYDATCNECGEERALSIPINFVGNSISEDISGLAFCFDVAVDGMTVNDTTAIYDNATVDGYKLLSMGAVVANYKSQLDIPAVYLCDLEPNSADFAVRIKNIPADKYDALITATPYIVLEIDGVATTIYGEAQTCSYNDVKN